MLVIYNINKLSYLIFNINKYYTKFFLLLIFIFKLINFKNISFILKKKI